MKLSTSCSASYSSSVFLDAMRVKYCINSHHYQDFYKTSVRKKLSDFLLEEERRDKMRAKRNQFSHKSMETATSPTMVCPGIDSSCWYININNNSSTIIDKNGGII